MSTTAASLLAFFEDLRSEGVAVGTSEILDAFSALEEVSWTDQRDFRESLAATVAKSQEDRRGFELPRRPRRSNAGSRTRASKQPATASTSTSFARRSAARSLRVTTVRCATSPASR